MTDNALHDELIGALVGLSRAAENNPNVTDGTYALFGESLALPEDCPPETFRLQIDAVRAEKHRISPDCAVCMNPCGRTADYDLSDLSANGEEVYALKLALLDEIRGMSKTLKAARRTGAPDREGENLLCTALFRLGYDEGAETLGEFLREINEFLKK